MHSLPGQGRWGMGWAAELRAAAGGLPRTFWTIWWGLLVNRLATFVGAFLATYLVRVRGLEAPEAGRVVALFGLGLTISGPLGGALADRFGRKVPMVGGLVAGAVSVGGLAFARGLPLLALLAFLAGAAGEIYRPAMNAAVADVVPPADRQRAYGLVYWAVNLGLAVGLLAAGLVARWSFAALFLADAATSAAFAVIVFLRVPETRPPGLAHEAALRGLGRTFADGPFAAFLALHLATLVVFVQWQLGLPLDMADHGLGPSAFSLLMALNCVGVVLLQPVLTPRLAAVDPARLLAAWAALVGLGFGVDALGGGLAVYALGAALWTVGEVVGFPAAASVVADLAPPELRGRYQGAYSMTFGLAFTIGPVLGGEIYGRLGGRTLWLACLAIGGLAAAGHLAAGGPRRRRLAAMREAPLPRPPV